MGGGGVYRLYSVPDSYLSTPPPTKVRTGSNYRTGIYSSGICLTSQEATQSSAGPPTSFMFTIILSLDGEKGVGEKEEREEMM